MNSIKTNTYPENDYRTYLIHYGKKGQKWGVRNAEWYPIADYQAHLARTGGNSKSAGSGKVTNKQGGSSTSSTMNDVKAILDGKKTNFKTKEAMLNAVCKDCYCPSAHADYKAYKTDKTLHERANQAAELGLKAQKKIDGSYTDLDEEPYDYIDPRTKKKVHVSSEEIHQGNIEWFLFEDQTLGKAMVADMINRGYSADQVKKLIDIIEKNSETIYDDETLVDEKWIRKSDFSDAVHQVNFEVSEGNYNGRLKYFADICEQVKNEQSGKISDVQSGFFDEDHKQRRAFSKELNKMDQKLAWDKRFYYDTVRNTRKFEQQLDKIKDPRSKEYKFVKSRLDASYDDTLKKAKGIEKYEKQISDKVDELERRGYRIKERPIERRTMTKGEIATSIGLTLLQYISPAPMLFVPTNKVNGTKYSVKASKQRDPDFKHSEKEREIAAKVKEHGYSSLTDYEKKVYNKAYK